VRGGNLPAAADAVDGLAGAALLAGDAEQAATLIGAAASLRGTDLVADHETAGVTEVADGAARALGPGRYAEARRRGRALTTEEVLGLAGE
jgi:hypothetical protein